MPDNTTAKIVHPNREKPASHAMRALIALLLLASSALILTVLFGGWNATSSGSRPPTMVLAAVDLLLAVVVLRWKRGALPIAAVTAVVVGLVSVLSAPTWFGRDEAGYLVPALDADLLGTLTVAIVPLQAVVIVCALIGFGQAWNVEVERYPGQATPRPGDASRHGILPTPGT